MKDFIAFIVLSLLLTVSAVSAQTCDCAELQTQIDALTAKIEELEGGSSQESVDIVQSDQDFEQVAVEDFLIDYIGYEIVKTDDGENIINIDLLYTNKSKESNSFMWSVNCAAFQDGIELESEFDFYDDSFKDIKPGKSLPIRMSFYLRSITEKVELNFLPFISFEGDSAVIRYIDID